MPGAIAYDNTNLQAQCASRNIRYEQMGNVGMAFWIHNCMRFKQWWLDSKHIGRS